MPIVPMSVKAPVVALMVYIEMLVWRNYSPHRQTCRRTTSPTWVMYPAGIVPVELVLPCGSMV